MATATISWFIRSGDSYARAEEHLISLDEKSVTFSRENLKYQLISEFPLVSFLHGDVLFMCQDKGGKLVPFSLPPTYSREEVFLVGEKPVVSPSNLKEMVTLRTEKLRKKLLDYQELIRFLVKLRAEKDIKSLDFIKDIQTFQDSLYGEFLKIIEQNIGDIAQAKRVIQNLLPKTPSPPANAPTPVAPATMETSEAPPSPFPALLNPKEQPVNKIPLNLPAQGPVPSTPPTISNNLPSRSGSPQQSQSAKTIDDKIHDLFQ